jgi:hypothetical protein
MKQFFTFLLFFGVISFATAQIQLNIASLKINMSVKATDTDVTGETHVKSTSTTKKTYQWERIVTNLPSGWKTQVCDPNLCYGSATSSAQFDLDPGQEFQLILHVKPDGTDGLGLVQVKITEVGTANSVVVEFDVNDFTSNTQNLDEFAAVNVYPNPIRNYFTIENAPNLVQSVQITDMSGRNVFEMNSTSNMRYDVPDLRKGTYVLMLRDDAQIVRKSLIINKL